MVTADAYPVPVPSALIEAIRSHPRFLTAVRESAVEIVAAHARNRLLNRLISDRGRALFGIYAMYLHFHADATGVGLTQARMAELCTGSGVCSRGRVRALLTLLRWAGHLVPQAGNGDRRRRPLVPTAKMLSTYRSRWSRLLAVVAPISPAAGVVAARIDRPEVFARLAVELGGILRGGFRLLDERSALVPVAERDNGFLLLLLLATSGDPAGPIPPREPVTVSISDLASRARVSRSHARNVLAVAERHRLIARDAEPRRPERLRIVCHPALADALHSFFVATFAVMAAAAIRVVDGDAADGEGPELSRPVRP